MSGFKERYLAVQERFARPERLGPLAERGGKVFCWCNRCAHHARIEARQLSLALGPDLPIPEVGARLRCSNCGAKDVATGADPTAAPGPAAEPDAAEWPACA